MRLIDADALTEDCKRYLGTLNPDRDGKECTRIHWLIGVLENASTIEPERKKGKWTIKNGELAFWDVCSVCGKMVMHKAPFYNFCPHCGARMEGR